MGWISQGTDYETGLPLWFNSDTGEMKYGQSGSTLNPDAYDSNGTMIATGWNPNMAFPAEQGGYSVKQLSSPYLANGGNPNDQGAFERYMRASYPLYNGSLNPDAIVPPSAMPESKGEGLGPLMLMAPAIGGIAAAGMGSGGGMWDWLGNLFGGDTAPVTNWADTWGDIGGLPGGSGGNLMPAAVPETAQQLTEWGLKETSPGMWSQPAMPNIQMGPGDWMKYGGQLFANSLGGQMANGLWNPNQQNWGMGGLFGAGLGALLGGLGESKQIGTATNTTTNGVNPALTGPSVNQLLSTIRGDYLNPASNPYLQDTYNMAAKSLTDNYSMATAPQTAALFGRGGQAFGDNSGYQQVQAKNQWDLGNNLQNLATNIYGQNYQTERGRQVAAASPFSGTSTINTTPIYANKLGGIMSGAMGGGILGSKLFG